MKIVIAGAGDMGFHLAELLSIENQDIILIDLDQRVLDYASNHLDLLTLRGDATSMSLLKQAAVESTDLVLAVTASEEVNLIVAILAKKLGARKVIARVNKEDYLTDAGRETVCSLGIDQLISPRQLAADEIELLVKQCSFTDAFDFEEGKLSLVGITLDSHSSLVGLTVKNIALFKQEPDLMPIAILRGHKTIIPKGDTLFRANDHVYFITRPDRKGQIETFVGRRQMSVNRVMIMGGTALAHDTACRLQEHYSVTIVEREEEQCRRLAEKLDRSLVIHGDYTNFDLLKEEGLSDMDVFIALTENSETNIIACLTAKNHGVYKTIAQVENKDYIHVSQDIGVDTLINKRLMAANNVFRFVRKGRIEAITSLHGVDAEVIEYVITKNNRMTKKPLKGLHFPDTAIIGGVIRGEESLIPNGDFQLALNDRVIVFALPEAISRLETLFR
ncbi:MAG: Trk system potassium transporter TrkA [Bacteroidota bacterium]